MAKKQDNVSDDRKAKTAIGGVTPTQLDTAIKNCNSIDADLAEARGDKAAALDRFTEAGGNKRAFKNALKVSNMEEADGQAFVKNSLEYLQHMGIIKDWKITFAQGDLLEGDGALSDDDGEGAAEPQEDVGQAQAKVIGAAHAAH